MQRHQQPPQLQEQQQAEFRTRIQQAVSDGTITQEKADDCGEEQDTERGPAPDGDEPRVAFLSFSTRGSADSPSVQRVRAADCATCYSAASMGTAACEAVCPMRLRPRVPKHQMFTCTQCAQCIAACNTVQEGRPAGSLLDWVDQDEARANEARMSLTGKR